MARPDPRGLRHGGEGQPLHHATGGWAYVRFHEGRPGVADYPRDKLRRWARRLAKLPGDTYVYFNNDTGGAGVRDALALRALLGARAR